MFNRLTALFPCYSLEDFDLERREDDAEQLLSSWSALWHPELLAAAQAIPAWLAANAPPMEPCRGLVVVPDSCVAALPDDWIARAEAAGACVLLGLRHRHEIVAAALQHLRPDGPNVKGDTTVKGDSPIFADTKTGTGPRPAVDSELVADFLALGHCYLQVELLTRKLRYMSNLDEAALQTATLAAAAEALRGDAAAARRHLQSAFDRLHEAREYFFPVEPRLLDLTLVAPSTLGPALREELAGRLMHNLLISGNVVEEIARREPETLASLEQALAAGSVALVGGEYDEIPLSLLDPEAIGQHLSRGLATYQRLLHQRPAVFGRRRFGLTSVLPQVLQRLGFAGAFHCTLDDGRFPTGGQSRIQWEGIDGTIIEAIGCVPVDAGCAAPFLAIAQKLSNAMSLDRTPTVVFAHWPGRSSCWYEDLRRIAAYGSVLGTFSTMTGYFEETVSSGQRSHYRADEYRSPYLKQDAAACRRDPISGWVRYFARRAKADAAEALDTLAALCGGGEKAEGGEKS